MSSRKTTAYESLADFNRHIDNALESVRSLSAYLQQKNEQYAVAAIEEGRATANIDALSSLHAQECADAVSFGISKREAQLGLSSEKPETRPNGRAVK